MVTREPSPFPLCLWSYNKIKSLESPIAPVSYTHLDVYKRQELTIRRFETNLGNWLADTARTSFADQGAQIAFLNAGGMRLNQNIPAGELNRRHLDTLFAYPTRLAMIRLSGAQLQAVVNHAITDWTGNGRWLQVSGFAFKQNPATGTAEQLSLITPQGLRPIQADETLLAVTNDYLLDASGCLLYTSRCV